jgi:hypothetical protein
VPLGHDLDLPTLNMIHDSTSTARTSKFGPWPDNKQDPKGLGIVFKVCHYDHS